METKSLTRGAIIRLAFSEEKTRVFHRQLYPESSAECDLSSGAEDNCAHLFFRSPFARSIWDQQTSLRVDITSESSF